MSTNVAAPTETRTWVRNPPPRCRYWRSAPIKAAEYKRSEQTYQRTAGESWVFAGRDQPNSRFACAPYRASKANRACQWSVCVVGLQPRSSAIMQDVGLGVNRRGVRTPIGTLRY